MAIKGLQCPNGDKSGKQATKAEINNIAASDLILCTTPQRRNERYLAIGDLSGCFGGILVATLHDGIRNAIMVHDQKSHKAMKAREVFADFIRRQPAGTNYELFYRHANTENYGVDEWCRTRNIRTHSDFNAMSGSGGGTATFLLYDVNKRKQIFLMLELGNPREDIKSNGDLAIGGEDPDDYYPPQQQPLVYVNETLAENRDGAWKVASDQCHFCQGVFPPESYNPFAMSWKGRMPSTTHKHHCRVTTCRRPAHIHCGSYRDPLTGDNIVTNAMFNFRAKFVCHACKPEDPDRW